VSNLLCLVAQFMPTYGNSPFFGDFSERKVLAKIFTLTFLFLVSSTPALALPLDGKVVGGSATIKQPNGQTLNINQLTDKAIINWKGFSINVNELVKFTQPGSGSTVLNRVTGVDPSSILGRLIANGRVFIVNPNGVLFGPSSVVDVAGLLATTLNIKDSDFMAGKFSFAQDPAKTPSYVINQGQIKVSDNGFVFLVAPGVANDGLVIANLGNVVMGSGERLTVDFMGDGLITFAIEGKVLNEVKGPDGTPLSSAVSNTGTIKADGGQVILTAKASSEIFSSVVNQSGIIEAKSLVNRGGVIRLEGSDPVANTGEIGWQANLGKVQNAEGAVVNTGTLDVSAAERGAAQGGVTLSGQLVGSSGAILARGADGAQGGKVLISSTDKTVLTGSSLIDTSGLGNSSAGNVVVWSDKDTVFRGTILGRGGDLSGDGGNVEVSGHENLSFFGNVDVSSLLGTAGTILLDPRDIRIRTGVQSNDAQVLDGQVLFADGGGGTDFTIGELALEALTGNVVLQAQQDIRVDAGLVGGLTFTNQTGGERVTFQAGRDINIQSSVTTNGAAIILEADSPHSTSGAANGTGSLLLSAAATSNGGAMTLIGSDFNITQNVNAGSGGINVSLAQNNSPITIGTGVLSNAEIGRLLTTGTLTIGRATTAGSDGLGTGALTRTVSTATIDSAVTIAAASGSAVQLIANDGVTLNNNLTTNQGTTINADADGGDNSGTLSVANTFTLNTSANTLSVAANDLNLNTTGLINSGGAGTALTDSDGSGIGLGGTAVTNGLNITGSELQNITANGLTLQTAGNITVNDISATNSNNISGTLTLNVTGGGSTVTFATNPATFNTLAMNADGNVNINADVTTNTGGASFVGGSIASNATVTVPAASAVSMTATTGGITDGNGAAANVVGGSLTASAITGIDLDTTITTLTSANVTGIGNVDISDTAGGLAVTSATTANGNITLNATGGDLVITTVTAAGSGADVALTTTTSGNITLGVVTAPDQVTLTSVGAITDTNAATNNITAANLAMTAATGIGSGDALETGASSLSATNTTSGDIEVSNTGVLDITGISNSGGGGVVVTNVGATTISGAVSAAGGTAAVSITASSPLLVIAPVTAPGDITLEAVGSVLAGDNLTLAANVTSTGGNMTLRAGDDISQTTGTVSTAGGTITATADTEGAGVADGDRGSFSQASGTSFSSSGGNITVSAFEDIGLALLDAGAAQVTVTSADGAITDANGAANNITANSLAASAVTGIDLDTTITTLTSANVTGTGNIDISDTAGGLAVTSATTTDGSITLNATSGDLTLGTVTAGGTGRNITATTTTSGNILVNNLTAAGDDITLSAASGGAINESGADAGADLTANTASLSGPAGIGSLGTMEIDLTTLTTASTTGAAAPINLSDTAGGLAVTSATTSNGNITLNATGGNLAITTVTAAGAGADVSLSTTTSGNITLGVVTAPDVVTLTSAGAITDTNAATNNITAANLAMTAATGIASAADPLETTVSNLEASGGTGGVFVTNSGALTIGGVSGALTGVSATGSNIILTASSPLTVNEPVSNTGGGNITLTAVNDGGNNDHLTINAQVNASGGSGNITLNAGTDLIVNNSALSPDISVAGTGTITANVQRDLSINANVDVESAAGTVALNFGQAGTGGTLTVKGTVTGGTVNATGGAGSDTFIGPDIANTWNTTGANSGNLTNADGTINFTSVENLTGGTGTDNFVFSDTATISGSIDGGAGTDTIDWSAYSTARSVTLTGLGSIDGFAGTEASIAGGFDNINALVGSTTATTDSLTVNGTATLLLGAGQVTQGAATTNYSQFENLTATTTAGNVNVDGVNVAGTVALTAVGAINSVTNDGTADITAGTVNLTANAGGIGTTSPVDVAASVALNANTSADSSNIFIDGIGNLPLGIVTAGSGNVTLNSTGAITDANAATDNITASTANLTAGTNIATSGDPLETTVGTLNATANAGGVFISEADAVTLGTITATGAGNDVVVTNTTGDMTVGTVTAPDQVTLTSTAGAILDGNDPPAGTINVTATTLVATAASGIGTASNPVEVTVSNLTTTGGTGSVFITNSGSSTSDTTSSTSGISAKDLQTATSDLDPERVNEFGPFTEMLLYALGDAYFEEKPENCEVDEGLSKERGISSCYIGTEE